MESTTLTAHELGELITRVFEPTPTEHRLLVLIDLPDDARADNDGWALRRQIAREWVRALSEGAPEGELELTLCLYRNVRANNADLPATGWIHSYRDPLPVHCDHLDPGLALPLQDILAKQDFVLAPTELSTTAPLKVLAPRLGFRAATMPGFGPQMIPALRIDYAEVNRRVSILKDLLDRAVAAELRFVVDTSTVHDLTLDLRHRSAHASGGVLSQPGTAGNLPSGEAYIVPYEGEHPHDPSASSGRLPVQFDDEVVVFEIVANRATRVLSSGPMSHREADLLRAEPAYGNLAELGLGVLGDFGLAPIGEVLLDEKLGLHIAFGRSEHFGGQVGPDSFSRPEAVVHQDYVYIARLQPRVEARSVRLQLAEGTTVQLITNGEYVIDFS